MGWDAPDSGRRLGGHRLQGRSVDGRLSLHYLTSSTTDTHYTHSSLSEGDTRYYRVSAINTNGTGAASSSVTATTAGVNVALHAPTISSPTCDGNTTVTIVDNTNALQDIVISMEWQIKGVVENVEWFVDKYRSDSYLGSDEGEQTGTGTLTITPDSDWPTEASSVELTIIGETAMSDYPAGTGPGVKIVFTRTGGTQLAKRWRR